MVYIGGVAYEAWKPPFFIDHPPTSFIVLKLTHFTCYLRRYHQGESDKDELVDLDRKRWEEYERSGLADSRRDSGFACARHDAFFEESRREEDEEEKKREARREIIQDLAQDTLKGRSEAKDAQAKRSMDKMARIALIRQKAQRQQQLSTNSGVSSQVKPQAATSSSTTEIVPSDPPSTSQGDESWIFGDSDGSEDEVERKSPDRKRRKLEE